MPPPVTVEILDRMRSNLASLVMERAKRLPGLVYCDLRLHIMGGTAQAAILHDGWKLIQFPIVNPNRFELYDIVVDPYETHDVSNEHADLVKSLSARIKIQTDWMP